MIQIAAPYQRRKARIEIIPLIDIIFFLLATFVLVSTSMVKNQGVPMRLPIAQTGKALEHKSALHIAIAKDGTYYLGKQIQTFEDIATRLQSIAHESLDSKVVIQADAEVQFEKVVKVLDETRRLGITKIAVQTAKKANP